MNRLLGVFFGAGRSVLIITVLLMVINVDNTKNKIVQSQLAPKFELIVTWLNQCLP